MNLRSEVKELRDKLQDNECVNEESEKLLKLKSENDDLKKALLVGVDEIETIEERLKIEKNELLEEVKIWKSKFEDMYSVHESILEELASTKRTLEEANKILALHPSTTKLDQILSAGQASHDHRGLGFVGSTSTPSPSTTTFVRAKEPVAVNVSTKGKGPKTATPKVDPKPFTTEYKKTTRKFRNIPIC